MNGDGDLSTDRAARVRLIVDACLRRRAAGEVLPDEDIIAAHQDLMPELADALRGLAIVNAAVARVQAEPTGSTGESSASQAETLPSPSALEAENSSGGDLSGTGPALRRRARHDGPGSSDRREEIAIPAHLGPVQLVREIGRGGMGAVFLGHHTLLKRNVAVKFMLDAVGDPADPSFALFLQGAQAAAGVRHAGLTSIYHADLYEGVPYLVMECIDGPTLAGVLRSIGRMSVPAALAAVVATTDAVAALHESNIVHRDIKPHNVLLDAQGRIFVTDFGLTLNRPPLGSAAGLAPAGTVAYMAPEMFDGLVSPRSDVYALGIMTFELLTGAPPFRAATFGEWKRCHAEMPLPVESLQTAGIDAGLIEVLERATHKNAMFRYKTAAQFRVALQSACPDAGALRTGAAELAALACRPTGAVGTAGLKSSGHPASSSYYDQLHNRASEKGTHRVTDRAQAPEVGTCASPTGDEPRPDSESLPALVLTVDSPKVRRRLRFVRAYMVTCMFACIAVYVIMGVKWNRWLDMSLLGPFVFVAFMLLSISDAEWLRRLRYRLANGLYPELARFPSDEERGKAWAEAKGAAVNKPGMWVFFGAWTLGFFALMFLVRWRMFSFIQPAGYLSAIPMGFLTHVMYSRHVRRCLRLRLVTLGVPICTHCGYDLRGQVVPRCPECGAAAIDPDSAKALLPNAPRVGKRFILIAIVPIAIVVIVVLLIGFGIWSGAWRLGLSEEQSRAMKLISDLEGRAESMNRQGDLAGAEREYRRALGIHRSVWSGDGDLSGLATLLTKLGQSLTKLARFADAEQVLLQAEKAYQEKDKANPYSDPNPFGWSILYRARVALYDDWHAAEPEKGYNRQAAAARAKLAEWESKCEAERATRKSKGRQETGSRLAAPLGGPPRRPATSTPSESGN